MHTENINNRTISKVLKRKLRFPFLALLFFIIGGAPAFGVVNPPIVESPTQEALVEYIQTHPAGVLSHQFDGKKLNEYEIGYRLTPSFTQPYEPGQLTDQETCNALNTIKIVRYMAGLSDNIYLSDVMNELCQSASFINYVNGSLSHHPSLPNLTDPLLSQMALNGSKNSNLARVRWENSSLNWSVINGWMYDGDSKNIKVLGHRRSILNPAMEMTGFGSVTGKKGTYNAMYVADHSNINHKPGCIPWPAQNMPTSYFPANSPWSFSIEKHIPLSNVSVILTRIQDNKKWIFRKGHSDGDFHINLDNYGNHHCIIFRPEGISQYKDGDRYAVSIVGDNLSYNYLVRFFDLEHYYSPTRPPRPRLSYFSPRTVTIKWSPVEGGDLYDVYRKTANGSWKLLMNHLDEPYFKDYKVGRGIKYYYRVVAKKMVSSFSYESPPSFSKSITIPLSKPRLYRIKKSRSGKDIIRWRKVYKATRYKIYRRVRGDKKWRRIGITTKNKFYARPKSNLVYEYRVRAYRTYRKKSVYSPYSNVRTGYNN